MTRRDILKTAGAGLMTQQALTAQAQQSLAMKGINDMQDYVTDLTLRPAEARGKADHGWLRSAHSFSFAQYFHPDHMGFGPLRVINDDRVAAKGGFPTHPHENFEIFSYVLDGQLEHKDSMGNGSVVGAGGVQYMSAGTGVRHSEFNPSATDPVHFLQIWVMPDVENQAPRYETLDISAQDKEGQLALFLSGDGRDGSMHIKADTDIYAATLTGEQSIETRLAEGRIGWVQVARGNLTVNGRALREGDGLAIHKGGLIHFAKGEAAEFLYFDMNKQI
jgi:redox-sensitive bicupin YhaK (pirin superfamily)